MPQKYIKDHPAGREHADPRIQTAVAKQPIEEKEHVRNLLDTVNRYGGRIVYNHQGVKQIFDLKGRQLYERDPNQPVMFRGLKTGELTKIKDGKLHD